MSARPNRAVVFGFTPRGFPFQWLADGMQAKGARDANQEQHDVIVTWQFRDAFLADIIGYTTYNPKADATLRRFTPMPSPYRAGYFCEEYDFVSAGAYESRSDFNDIASNQCIVQDWARYRLTFRKPRYPIYTDFLLAAVFANRESERYCTLKRAYHAREKRVSGLGFEYEQTPGNWVAITEEAGFVMDHTIRYVITWHEVPVDAYPFRAQADGLGTVNHADWQPFTGGPIFWKETLLFKGPYGDIDWYEGVGSSKKFFDTPLVFEHRPRGGWNQYEKRELGPGGARQFVPIRRVVADGTSVPPYLLFDFDKFFKPEAVA